MRLTTLCYIKDKGRWLMLHRIKKEKDVNAGKWVGVGGGFENGESPENCLYREVKEETGLDIISHVFRGVVTFCSDIWEDEMIFLYTCDAFEGELIDCNEGRLEWIDETELLGLNMWEGDRIFLELISKDSPVFSLKLSYKGNALVGAELNGAAYEI